MVKPILVDYIGTVKRFDAPLPIEVEIRGEKAQALGRTQIPRSLMPNP